MTKTSLENRHFGNELEELDCILKVNLARNEIEARIKCENPTWGLPSEVEELMKDDGFSNNTWGIVDISGITESENGNAFITVYFKMF